MQRSLVEWEECQPLDQVSSYDSGNNISEFLPDLRLAHQDPGTQLLGLQNVEQSQAGDHQPRRAHENLVRPLGARLHLQTDSATTNYIDLKAA